MNWRRPLSESVRLSLGAEGLVQTNRIEAGTLDTPGPGPNNNPLTNIGNAGELYTGGAYAELAWKLGEDLVVVPGVRGDVYRLLTAKCSHSTFRA